MNANHAPVPAVVLRGGSIQERDAAITRLAEPEAAGRPIAVLRLGSGVFGGQSLPLTPHIAIRQATIGCPCCTSAVLFRIALVELLRTSRPARLIIDLGAGDHVAVLEMQLKGESLCRAVRIVDSIDLDTGGRGHTP